MPAGSSVVLTFSSFELEGQADYDYPDYDMVVGDCWDWVEVTHGSYIEQFCGDIIPDPITSRGNTMMVSFLSDGLINFTGFSASCRGHDGSQCTITLAAPPTTTSAPPPTSAAPPSTSAAPPSSEAPSTFQSPNFPNNYPLGLFQVTIVL